MTARQVFEATLIELSKVQAPALKLYEFNYLFNKAINLYINKVYNVYDVNQQTTDDLRVLKSTAYLTPKKWNSDNSALHNSTTQASSYLSRAHRSIQSLHGATYEVAMPIDYLHLLNCVCIYYVAKQKDCWDAGSYIEIPATRLTADSWSQIVSDIYNRPSPMKPYYYIHNQNNQTNNELLPTDPIMGLSSTGLPNGTDMTGTFLVISNGLPVTFLKGAEVNSDSHDIKLALSRHKDIRLTAKEIALPEDADPDKPVVYKWTSASDSRGNADTFDYLTDDHSVCILSLDEDNASETGFLHTVTCVLEYSKKVSNSMTQLTSTTVTSDNTWKFTVYDSEENLIANNPGEFSEAYTRAFANIQGDWYEITGLQYKDGVVSRIDLYAGTYDEKYDLQSVLKTGGVETCGKVADATTLAQLLYNPDGSNVTGMFYPDPSETLGWARKPLTETPSGVYQTRVKLAEEAIEKALNNCVDNPGAYRAAVDEYRIARALLDLSKNGYILTNQNEVDDSGVASSNFPRTFKFDMNGDGVPDTNVSLVEKPTALRAGNVSNVRMEIRYGKDDSLFLLKEVQVDYVKAPQFIRLTQEQIDLTEDTSQIMEFPDYVNQEIINELVHLVMERVNDPRLSNNLLMTQTIARPTGQLAQPALALAQLRG